MRIENVVDADSTNFEIDVIRSKLAYWDVSLEKHRKGKTYLSFSYPLTMAGETGGTGKDLPLRAPLISFPGWDPWDPIYNKMGPFYFPWTIFQQLQ